MQTALKDKNVIKKELENDMKDYFYDRLGSLFTVESTVVRLVAIRWQ